MADMLKENSVSIAAKHGKMKCYEAEQILEVLASKANVTGKVGNG
jgi:hypothetical protein